MSGRNTRRAGATVAFCLALGVWALPPAQAEAAGLERWIVRPTLGLLRRVRNLRASVKRATDPKVEKARKADTGTVRRLGNGWVGDAGVDRAYLTTADGHRISEDYSRIELTAGQLVGYRFNDGYTLLDGATGKVLRDKLRYAFEAAGALVIEDILKDGAFIWDTEGKRPVGERHHAIWAIGKRLVAYDNPALSSEIVSGARAKPEDYGSVLDPQTGKEIDRVPLFNSRRWGDRQDKRARRLALKKRPVLKDGKPVMERGRPVFEVGPTKEQAYVEVADFMGEWAPDSFPSLHEMSSMHLFQLEAEKYLFRFSGDGFSGAVDIDLSSSGHWTLGSGMLKDDRGKIYDPSEY